VADAARPPTVLVVDDERPILGLLQQALGQRGIHVIATDDPAAAVHLAVEVDPDLILCDVVMPGLDGFELLRLLQCNPLTAVYPVVFVSAYCGFAEKLRAFEAGAMDFIARADGLAGLLERLPRILRRAARASREIRGQIEETSIEEMLNLLRDHRRSGDLRVEAEEVSASILVQDGEVLDVRCGERGLVDALGRVLDLTQGSFVFRAGAPPRASEAQAAPATSREPAAARVELPHPRQRPILLIDDEPLSVKLFQYTLESKGYEVTTATTGREGLELARRLVPALIISDVGLPDLDGWSVCRQVRQTPSLRATPFLFLSGRDSYHGSVQALAVGADDFLPKELPLAEFLRRVQAALNKDAELRQKAEDPSRTVLQGRIQDFGIVAVVELMSHRHKSGVLVARCAHTSSSVRFRHGEILSASVHGLFELEGPDAFLHLLSWDSGSFELFFGDLESGGQMRQPLADLLADGCRVLDERRRHAEEQLRDPGCRIGLSPKIADLEAYADTLAQETALLLRAAGSGTTLARLGELPLAPAALQSRLRELALQGWLVLGASER
jgi:DNA-binding response OmpR family regulator